MLYKLAASHCGVTLCVWPQRGMGVDNSWNSVNERSSTSPFIFSIPLVPCTFEHFRDRMTSDFWRCPTRAYRRVSQYCTQKHVVFSKYFAEMRPVPQTKLYTTEKWTKNGAHVVLISSFNERYSTFNSLRIITKQLSTTCLVFFAFLVGQDEKFPKYARHNKDGCGLVLL